MSYDFKMSMILNEHDFKMSIISKGAWSLNQQDLKRADLKMSIDFKNEHDLKMSMILNEHDLKINMILKMSMILEWAWSQNEHDL